MNKFLPFVIILIIFNIIHMTQFFPPNEDFKRAVEQVLDEKLNDRIFDIVWKRMVHYFTFFESLDGFGTSGGAPTIANNQVELITGAVSGNVSALFKQPDQQGLSTFSQKSRFRTAIQFPTGQDDNFTLYITVGNVQGGAQGYGFKIVATTNSISLRGVTHNGTSENVVTLQSLSANQTYLLEARYDPVKGVIWFADNPTTSPTTFIREVGSTGSNLPSAARVGNTNLMYFHLTTNENAEKRARFSMFEYLQQRDVLR